MTFALEANRTDRMAFGTARIRQGGDWTMLQPAFARAYVPAFLSAAAISLAVFEAPSAAHALWLTGPWTVLGLFHYRIEALRLLTRHKRAGDLSLVVRFTPRGVGRIVLDGGARLAIVPLGIVAVLAVMVTIVPGSSAIPWEGGAIGWGAGAASSGVDAARLVERALAFATTPAGKAAAALGGAVVLGLAVLWSALRLVVLTLPVWRHVLGSLTLTGTQALAKIGQPGEEDPVGPVPVAEVTAQEAAA